ncbi:hypothetical protein ABCR94_25495 [Streptomyces sp. 21So2-11]|uniref:hypothetical protein n=1 Tax=Streptomyces sp. 21So2-11 TaxID=3144408 RepID=UPI00321B5806
MTTSDREAPRPLSMRDLLASCAAATAVSTPPTPGRAESEEAPRPAPATQAEERCDAA